MSGLAEERADLARTLRTLLDRRSGSLAVRAAVEAPRGYDEKLWSLLCEQVGVAALAVPEHLGGVGAGVQELQVVAEELGRTLTPSPLLGSTVLATQALLACRDDAARARLLPALADGSATAALAWTGADGSWDTGSAACVADDGVLAGQAHYVLDGDHADVLLVVAVDGEGLGLFEVDPDGGGVRREHGPSMDPTRRLATVALDGARGRRLGAGDFRPALEHVADIAQAVLAAEQVGAASRALELTVDYTRERVQFGRPIGGFQALKHRMADLYVLVEAARSAAAAAGAALDDGAQAASSAALTADVCCSEAFSRVAAEMIQLHGGIAITWEHDAHLYFKRAHSAAQLLGQPHTKLDRSLLGRG